MDKPKSINYGEIKLGRGDFKLSPVLIGTMFYQGQSFVERETPENFNERIAKKRIENHKSLAKKYKLPELVEISGNDAKSIKKYLEFYLDYFEPPFILGGTLEARMAGINYLKERGIKSTEFIYNTISNLKNTKELNLIRENNIESVVVLIVGSEHMSSTQRFNYLVNKNQPNEKNIIEGLEEIGVKYVWIDGGVTDLESLAHVIETQQIVSSSLGLPVGTAPNNFLFKYSSPRLNEKYHTRYRRASIMHLVSWYSNFIFYGAIEDARESFSATFQAREFKKAVKENNIKLLDKEVG